MDPNMVPDAVTVAALLGGAALMGIRSKYLAWPIAIVLLGGSYIAIDNMKLTDDQHTGALIGLVAGSISGAFFAIVVKAMRNRNRRTPPDQRDKR